MEFDKNTPQAVSDEERRLAETKKLTLQPVHDDIAPEAASDSEIASRHLIEPAIGNVANDTEQDTSPIQPSRSFLEETKVHPPKKQIGRIVLTTIAIGTVVVGAILLLSAMR